MSASKVLGKDVVLRAQDPDDLTYYGFYCAQEVAISIETDQLPATGPNHGGWARFKPGRSRWEMTFSGLLFIKDSSDSSWAALDLTTEQARQSGLNLLMTFTNENGNFETYSGRGNPASTSISGSAPGGALAKWSVRFVGDGDLTQNADIPQYLINDVQKYEYIGVGGETFFVNAALVNRTILGVFRESISPVHTITSGTPDPKQMKYTAASGRMDFDNNPALEGEQFVIQYR